MQLSFDHTGEKMDSGAQQAALLPSTVTGTVLSQIMLCKLE